MKRVLFIVSLLMLSISAPTYAASNGLPAGTPAGQPPVVSGAPDYLSAHAVPLSPKETRALELSEKWTKTNIPPVLSSGGKIIYVHGAVLPSIIGSPMQVCDVELQSGEKVKEIVVGDSARWLIESGSSGKGAGETVHLFIKPVDSGLESTAIVTTDRRTYHLRLISRRTGHTPYVGFQYVDQLRQSHTAQKMQQEKEQLWNSTEIDGHSVDVTDLNFNYKISGDRASWKPEKVYDDGRQIFIRLPAKSRTGEMPVLLVRKGSQDVLVNYRVKASTLVVDGIFDRIALIIGVGGKQKKVDIRRMS